MEGKELGLLAGSFLAGAVVAWIIVRINYIAISEHREQLEKYFELGVISGFFRGIGNNAQYLKGQFDGKIFKVINIVHGSPSYAVIRQLSTDKKLSLPLLIHTDDLFCTNESGSQQTGLYTGGSFAFSTEPFSAQKELLEKKPSHHEAPKLYAIQAD